MKKETTQLTSDPSIPYGDIKPLQSLHKISEKEIDETIRIAVEKFGKEHQTRKLFEEMAELQVALCQLADGRDTTGHVCEEIADVIIMCLQMAQIYGPELVERYANQKIFRLKTLLTNLSTQIQ